MTHLLKCDGCGKTVTAPVNYIGEPYNPDGWRSRLVPEKKITVHACSEECLTKCKEIYGGVVAPF